MLEDRTTIYKKSDLIVSVNDDEEVETNAEPVAENEKEPSGKEDNTEKFLSFGISFAGLPDISLGVAQTSACLTIQAPIGTPRLTIHHVDFTSIGETRVMNLIRYALSKREKIFYRDL